MEFFKGLRSALIIYAVCIIGGIIICHLFMLAQKLWGAL